MYRTFFSFFFSLSSPSLSFFDFLSFLSPLSFLSLALAFFSILCCLRMYVVSLCCAEHRGRSTRTTHDLV